MAAAVIGWRRPKLCPKRVSRVINQLWWVSILCDDPDLNHVRKIQIWMRLKRFKKPASDRVSSRPQSRRALAFIWADVGVLDVGGPFFIHQFFWS
jgi:hypothetical protein